MNKRQKVFVQEYLKDLNATQAAIRAGYSSKTARAIANRLLTNVDIAKAVKSAMDIRAKKTEITQEWVINRLKQIAGTNMTDLADWNQSGITFKDSSSISDDAKASVQQIEQVMNEHGGTLKIKQCDKIRALELLGKHIGMFTEKAEVSHTFERKHAEASDEDLQNVIGKA